MTSSSFRIGGGGGGGTCLAPLLKVIHHAVVAENVLPLSLYRSRGPREGELAWLPAPLGQLSGPVEVHHA